MTPEEKKAWAEDLLRQKYAELGRLPTKKDFDNVACAQIKAYLGPWPRALESAGLKTPKEKPVGGGAYDAPNKSERTNLK